MLDAAEVALVQVAAAIAGAADAEVRAALVGACLVTPHAWVEEVILQSYLFAGFPRALNAAHAWRAVSASPAPAVDAGADAADWTAWTARGEATCAIVYGARYERLRANVRALHPALDAWMIGEGYGKVLSRPGLDLRRRELCIVAACAASGQERQLVSHLHGARHAGATVAQLHDVLRAVDAFLPTGQAERAALLLQALERPDVH